MKKTILVLFALIACSFMIFSCSPTEEGGGGGYPPNDKFKESSADYRK